jgi:hypothetical protein
MQNQWSLKCKSVMKKYVVCLYKWFVLSTYEVLIWYTHTTYILIEYVQLLCCNFT